MRESLIALGRELKERNYKFVAITPESHRRVLERGVKVGGDPLHDLFGWNRAVNRSHIPPRILDALEASGQCETTGDRVRSLIRFATLEHQIFLHSAFPTNENNAVFFGPDSYRFVRFIKAQVASADTLMDVGCGSGVGGVSLSQVAKRIILADINPRALEFAEVNVVLNNVRNAEFLELDVRAGLPPTVDTIIANPPFIVDPKKRAYRDGGDHLGSGLSLEILNRALALECRVAIYTGTAICDGRDTFLEKAKSRLVGRKFSYTEIDPDIFGEELSEPAYSGVDRLAAVGLVVEKPNR